MHRPVLVLNASYEAISVVSARRAVVLVLADKAELVEPDEAARVLRSPSIMVPVPSVVRLMNFVKVPRRRHGRPSRRAILLRDRYECAYCTERWADTVDHVVPTSRGGMTSWRNCVSACAVCNRTKGDRLPAELGWKLRYQPTAPAQGPQLVDGPVAPAWRPYLAAA
jgi:5-methylcytosine-specific restriction endonuclease McrA